VFVGIRTVGHIFPLAAFGIVWEFPTMKVDNAVTKLDSRLRGIFPSDFAPGDVLEREIPEPGTVLFRLLKPAEAPLMKARKWRGKVMGAKRRLDPAKIAAAIRADRDSR
jgi:hypothetical protein